MASLRRTKAWEEKYFSNYPEPIGVFLCLSVSKYVAFVCLSWAICVAHVKKELIALCLTNSNQHLVPPTDPPLLSFLFCADVAELIFGWTAKYWQSRIFIYQFLFSKVFPSIFSYCFSPMLYRAAGWCPQQTPDIWQAGCFSSFMFFPMFSLSSFSKNFPWCFSYCFFFPMLYRPAGWCPQQTPDIWQAGPPRWDKA